jgi:hypothetical protein
MKRVLFALPVCLALAASAPADAAAAFAPGSPGEIDLHVHEARAVR